MKNEENRLANYEALKAYIEDHHHLPPKKCATRGEISTQLVQIRPQDHQGRNVR